jgi:hypothetical protein
MTTTILTLQNTINEKQSEIEILKNGLTEEIKKTISSEVEVEITDWVTYISTISNGRQNRFSIYHDSSFSGKRKYEVSWFSSTLNLNNDNYGYSDYLIVLGQTIVAMKNGLQDVFDTYLDKIKLLSAEIQKMGWEIKRELSDIEINKVKENLKGNSGSIKMNTTVVYYKSKRTHIFFTEINWTKTKKGYDVYFKHNEEPESKKIVFDELTFINYLIQVKSNIFKYD